MLCEVSCQQRLHLGLEPLFSWSQDLSKKYPLTADFTAMCWSRLSRQKFVRYDSQSNNHESQWHQLVQYCFKLCYQSCPVSLETLRSHVCAQWYRIAGSKRLKTGYVPWLLWALVIFLDRQGDTTKIVFSCLLSSFPLLLQKLVTAPYNHWGNNFNYQLTSKLARTNLCTWCITKQPVFHLIAEHFHFLSSRWY